MTAYLHVGACFGADLKVWNVVLLGQSLALVRRYRLCRVTLLTKVNLCFTALRSQRGRTRTRFSARSHLLPTSTLRISLPAYSVMFRIQLRTPVRREERMRMFDANGRRWNQWNAWGTCEGLRRCEVKHEHHAVCSPVVSCVAKRRSKEQL